MNKKASEKYFFFGLLTVVGVLTLLIFQPFLTVIIVGASLAIVFNPVYEWFSAKVVRGTSWLASLLTVLVFLVLLVGPLFGIGAMVFGQTQDLYNFVVSSNGDPGPFIAKINKSVNAVLPTVLEINVQEKFKDLVEYLSSNITVIFATTLSTIFSLFLVILSFFYFMKDGHHWKKSLIMLSPLGDNYDEQILRKLGNAVNGVVKGYLLIGLIQGVLMGVGLWIFGVPNPALWGVLTGIASLVPTIGTALVAIPAILFLFAIGDNGAALGLSIWSVIIVGTIDNLLNPIIVGNKIDVPPLLILFAVLGGIAFMGPVGILIGPLTVSFLYTLVSIYRTRFQA